jgi:hypothetical protein
MICQHDGVGVPDEKASATGCFQLADVLADRGLAQVQAVRRRGKTQGFRDSAKAVQPYEVKQAGYPEFRLQ